MLAALALAAFMSDADAQTRRSSDVKKSTPARQSSSARQSSQASRPSSASQTRKSSDNNRKTAVTRQSAKPAAPERKPSTTVSRPSQQTRPAQQARPSVTKPNQQARPSNTRPVQTRPSQQKPSAVKKDKAPDFKPGDQNKPMQVTRPAPNRPKDNNSANRPSVRPDAGPGNAPGRPNDRPEMRPGGHGNGPDHGRPDHRHDRPRVHPRDRDFMRWDRPSYFWSHHDHCYGHRVRVLPSHVHRHVYHGITYYCYNDIWYRPYGGYYIVCRPPYGISLAANIIADMAWTAVRLSYYNTVANTYSQINENNAYIAEQNAIIAQNNATIAAQNAAIAQNQSLAQASYDLANELGLIQSYAAVSSEYFYQDGVFYAKDASGQYNTIIPPAGALVETLPEDYDMVTLKDGKEYYKVDDTVFKVTLAEGKPYFEVIGQMYS